MKRVIVFILDRPTQMVKLVERWAEAENLDVILLGLLKEDEGEQEENSCWRRLFEVQEELGKEGREVSVLIRKGDICELVSLAQTVNVAFSLIPKDRILALDQASLEYFLSNTGFPILIY